MGGRLHTLRQIIEVLGRSGIRGKLCWVFAVLALVYLVSPVDFIPDALLGPGQLDDLLVILSALGFALRTYKKNKEIGQGD